MKGLVGAGPLAMLAAMVATTLAAALLRWSARPAAVMIPTLTRSLARAG